MNHRERFHALMNFQAVDRLPLIEWATWWDRTIARWHDEGLPEELTDGAEIRAYFGLDPYYQMWFGARGPGAPAPAHHGAGIVSDMDGYRAIKQYLYPEPDLVVDRATLEHWARRQAEGEAVIWITIEGFFWYPRTLLGIAEHLTAFYEQAELMHVMNEDLLAYHHRILDAVFPICRPDFMTFAEDMSYNHGPMLSSDLFRQFITPCYRRIIPKITEAGVIPIIDTDGDVTQLVPWFAEAGVDAFLPLERQAGCDILALKRQFPGVRLIGAYDKMVMTQGEAAMRSEFERLLPAMRQGGFIPSVDHQTPPGVPLAEYRVYLRLLREYCARAATG
ncbi:MAG: hypothetical protein HZB26_03160 [Candidatus Hydrogenedentes bacterium]|nr:hypothetical protein [Candidatus Hydrogenedentota bacterium]